MGFFDFLFGKKKDDKQVIKEFEAIKTVQSNTDNLIAKTSFSETRKEKAGTFEYIDFYITGTAYNQDSIKKALKENMADDNFFEEKYEGLTNKEIIEDTFDEPVFEHSDIILSESYLKLEPDNEYDSKAIAVYSGELKLGYIPEKDFSEAKDYIYSLLNDGLKDNQTLNFTAILSGGKYKVNRDGESIETGESNLKLDGQITIKTEH